MPVSRGTSRRYEREDDGHHSKRSHGDQHEYLFPSRVEPSISYWCQEYRLGRVVPHPIECRGPTLAGNACGKNNLNARFPRSKVETTLKTARTTRLLAPLIGGNRRRAPVSVHLRFCSASFLHCFKERGPYPGCSLCTLASNVQRPRGHRRDGSHSRVYCPYARGSPGECYNCASQA